MFTIPPYPRTLHVGESGGGSKHHCPFDDVAGAHLVVEEKVDGSHCGLGFDTDAELRVFSRNTLLERPVRSDFRMLDAWAQLHVDALWEVLGERYVLYGEWALVTHSIFYDALPSYFLEDDVFDRRTKRFLCTARRRRLLEPLPSVFGCPVEVLYEGAVDDASELRGLVGPSRYKSPSWPERCPSLEGVEDSDAMEGLYIKVECDGVVERRLKWVRPGFLQHIAQAQGHWRERAEVRNQLLPPSPCG